MVRGWQPHARTCVCQEGTQLECFPLYKYDTPALELGPMRGTQLRIPCRHLEVS